MTEVEQRTAAVKFAADWKNRGVEKQETQRFGIVLLTKVTINESEAGFGSVLLSERALRRERL